MGLHVGQPGWTWPTFSRADFRTAHLATWAGVWLSIGDRQTEQAVIVWTRRG